MHTCLFRKIHLQSKSFRTIGLLSLICLILFTGESLWRGLTFPAGLFMGGRKGFAIFLTWLFARELDPDSKVEAFYGVLPLVFVLFFYDQLLVIPCFFILCCMRLVTRSAGQEPSLYDLLFLLCFAVFIYFTESFIFLLFGGIYILRDSRGKGGKLIGLPFALFMIVIALLSFVNLYTVESVHMDLKEVILAGIITAMFAYRLSTLRQIFSMDDKADYYLSPRRIRDAGTITLMLGIMIAVNLGYVIQVAPLWFAMLGVSFPFLKNIAREQRGKNNQRK